MAKSSQYVPVIADANVKKEFVGAQVKRNQLLYGKDVVEDRAVPDFRDGCKPSQRRLLYAMHILGLKHSGASKKSARVVGDTIGKYHPHGDVSLYGALVTMTHMRYPIADHCGMNFGNRTNGPAAMRYTETKFTKIAVPHFECIDVADTMLNYSADEKEPIIINTRLPLLMMNGAGGQPAYGMVTNIPAHNLRELVEALTFTLKNFRTVTTADLMQFLKGPDLAYGGILTSKPAEVLEVYDKGFGRLTYRCTYHLDRKDSVTEVVVTEFPDPFDIQKFLERCGELHDQKIVKRVQAMSEKISSDPKDKSVRYVVRVSVDNKTALDKVLALLDCSDVYRFNVIIRGIDEEHTEVTSMNFVTWAKKWLRWRKREEEKMLELERSKLCASLHKEILRLKGILNIDTVIAAIKQDAKDPAEYLAEALNITLEDAQFIGAIPVFQLKKANVDEQRNKIRKLKEEIARVDDDLAHLSRVILRQLAALSPYFDERRTKLNARGPQLSKFETTGDPVIVAASTDGKLFSHLDEKSSTTSELFAVGTFTGSVLFARSGMTCYMSPNEMSGKAGPAYKEIVGIAAQECSHIFGLGDNGYCVMLPMQQRKSEFPLIKNAELVFGGGLTAESKVLIWGDSGEFQALAFDKIPEATRTNVTGSRLVKFKPVKVVVLHAGQNLYDVSGSSVALSRAQDATASEVFAIGDRNIIFLKSGRRKILDRKATIKLLASAADVKSFYPVTI